MREIHQVAMGSQVPATSATPQWQRIPEFDYEFSVIQRRYGGRWESTKEMHRRHPSYDLSAGPRDQTYSFNIEWSTPANEPVVGTVWSTLGDGTLRTDREFRKGILEIAANVSSFAPFNTYRITQDYRYEEGKLVELVELFKKKGDAEQPWVKNEEEARLFSVRTFDGPPTRLAAR
jgi:hypothetical protein